MKTLALALPLLVAGFFPSPSFNTRELNTSFAAVSVAQSENHGGQIDSQYDGFSHETVITLRKMKVTCGGKKDGLKDTCVSVMASLHCPGIQLDYVRFVKLRLVFESEDWDQRHPMDQRDLTAVVDGETFRMGRMELVSQSVDTLMSEGLEVPVPYKLFKKMVLAQTVEFQVGKSRFELNPKNMAALRDLNNRVKF